MRVQLWSYNYDPEPLGIGPVSTLWARTMSARGYEVEVVAAHPHYPKPQWGRRLLPYREIRDGIPVTRLPLVVGRETSRERFIQELSFLASQTLASPFLGTPDAQVSVSPSFPALLPAMLNTKSRRIPWTLWLQDILPDGAAATGYVEETNFVYKGSRLLENAAYRCASSIAVLSNSFRKNLIEKGVPDSKLTLIYNPATLPVRLRYLENTQADDAPRIICIGNIGRSQGLVEIVKDFESNQALEKLDARLVITGSGVAEQDVRAAISTNRVELTGLLGQDDLEDELKRATLGAVTQAYESGEFNVPSKLMNYLAVGLPVVASVRESSEAARIVREASAGWIAPEMAFGETAAQALSDLGKLREMSLSGHEFAKTHLTATSMVDKFVPLLRPPSIG